MLIDTHCHIHEADYPIAPDKVIANAHAAGVMKMICVGTDNFSSNRAVEFANQNDGVFASVGIHPHSVSSNLTDLERTISQAGDKLVAVGEIGLDYHYDNSPRDVQIELLNRQIELALKFSLPIIFHVRDAFDDFWPVLDNFHGVRGVLHSFTDTAENATNGLVRGFYFGINGIVTFTRDSSQQAMFASLPIERLLLETDAPFLTPTPYRGKISTNEPAFIKSIAEFIGESRGLSLDEVAAVTTANARKSLRI